MANEPTFNPNAFRDRRKTSGGIRAVQDLYEPGSTFKIVTASAAIEEKVMSVDAIIDTSPGVIRIDRTRKVDEFRGHNYGALTFMDVIVKSSNVGAIKIGFKVGTERMSRYVERFGFGRPISPDFPGESPGIVWRAEKWTDSALASVSMGYQVGVTPLQMVAAVSSVANGGELIEPRKSAPLPRKPPLAVTPKACTPDQREHSDPADDHHGTRRQTAPRSSREFRLHIAGRPARRQARRRPLLGYENNVSFVGSSPSGSCGRVIVVSTPARQRQQWRRRRGADLQADTEATVRYRAFRRHRPAPPVLVAAAMTVAHAGGRPRSSRADCQPRRRRPGRNDARSHRYERA